MHRSVLAPSLSALTLALVLTPLAPAAATPAEEAGAPSSSQVTGEAPPEVTDRMIVKYRDDAPGGATEESAERVVEEAAEKASVPEAEEATGVRTTGDGAAVVALDGEVSTGTAQELAEELEKDPDVVWAEPDRLVFTARTPGTEPAQDEQMASVAAAAYDADAPYMWALGRLDAFRAWDTATGRGVTIGVVDTGFANHPDLDAKTVDDYDFVSTANLGNDGNGRDADGRDPGTFSSYGQCYPGSPASNSIWHGTHVAGTAAAASNTFGTVGIARDATLLNARALGACGTGYVSDMADAVRWLAGDSVPGVPAAKKRADVINMSLSMGGSCPVILQNAINTAWSRSIPVAVAAGNVNQPAINHAPGNCYNVITVGAVTSANTRASYSNHGWAVDIYAPGHYIHSSGNTGTKGPVAPNTRIDYGTSMASPHVAGTLALLKQKNPGLTADQYKKLILDSGDPFAEGKTLNTHDALYITKAGTTVTPAAPAPTPLPTSSYTTKGAIGTLYHRMKDQLGQPTSNERPVGNGVYQTFTKGTVYWTSATGAYAVRGGVAGSYKLNGAATGQLGFPRSDEKPNGLGGVYQLFQRGKILWSPQSGAYALTGRMDEVFDATGHERGLLGYPTGEKKSNGAGGWYQTFQRGRILANSAGAHPIAGAVSSAYTRAGSEHGALGYPTSGELKDGSVGVYQAFQRGRIVWSPSSGARVLKGAIGARHGHLGSHTGALGYPTSDEAGTGSGGSFQQFQKGRIYWSAATGAREVQGSIGSAYLALGGTKSRMGFPSTGEIELADKSVVQRFQGGTITWRPGGSVRIDYR